MEIFLLWSFASRGKKPLENILNIYILENKVPAIKRELNSMRLLLPDLEGCENLILAGVKDYI